jgi:hypothetical protein
MGNLGEPLPTPKSQRLSIKHLPVAIFDPTIQIHILQHGTKALCVRGRPRSFQNVLHNLLRHLFGVLDVENRLACVDEGTEHQGLVVLHALLVDAKVDKGEDRRDDVAGILESDGEVERVRFCR